MQSKWLLPNAQCRDANFAEGFAVFLGLKKIILDEKNSIFICCAILFSVYTCVVINLEKKNSIFLESCSIFEVSIFIKKEYKILQKK